MKYINAMWHVLEKAALWCLNQLFRILHKEMTPNIEEGFLQFVRFGLVGVSNTVVNYIIYAVSLVFMKQAGIWKNYDYLIATVVSFVLSVLWSFFWNYKFVFKVEDGEQRAFFPALMKTYVSYAFTGLFLNSILMVFWVQVVHISEFLGPVFNLLLSVPINFFMNKFWAFKNKERV